jgi:hypothetical protein
MPLPPTKTGFSKEPLFGFPKNNTYCQALKFAKVVGTKKPSNGVNRSGAYSNFADSLCLVI